VWSRHAHLDAARDADLAAAYCVAYGEFVDANEKISKTSTVLTRDGKLIPNPFVAVRDRAFETMLAMRQELGIDIQSRWDAIEPLLALPVEQLEYGDAGADARLAARLTGTRCLP
jgi:phage terminase small subunit